MESVYGLVEAYVGQDVNPELDMSGSEQLLDAWKMMIRGLHVIRSRKCVDTWDVPLGRSRDQAFPPHVVHFISNLFNEYILPERERQMLLPMSLSICQGRFS